MRTQLSHLPEYGRAKLIVLFGLTTLLATGPAGAQEHYDQKIEELETSNRNLAAKVELAKARLEVLEAKATGRYAETRAKIIFRTEVDGLRLKTLNVILDDKPLVTKHFNGDIPPSVTLLEGPTQPGSANLEVHAVFVGDSSLFTYYSDYKYTVRNTWRFEIRDGYELFVELVPTLGKDVTKATEDQLKIEARSTYSDQEDLRREAEDRR